MNVPAHLPATQPWFDMPNAYVDQQLFLLIDLAVDVHPLAMIRDENLKSGCLFGYAVDAPIAVKTPRLVQIDAPSQSQLLRWFNRPGTPAHAATLLASATDFDELLAHLKSILDVELEGIDTMYLAFWDPAILATLMGSPADQSLHVPGPVLRSDQAAIFRGPVIRWWYRDRRGQLHDALAAAGSSISEAGTASTQIALNAEQVDQLVEAAVPDHLLQHVRQNQPELLANLEAHDHYDFMREQLRRAREHGLHGTGDLVNYLCLALAFGAQFDEVPDMAALLQRVSQREMNFDAVMKQANEAALDAAKKAPALLREHVA